MRYQLTLPAAGRVAVTAAGALAAAMLSLAPAHAASIVKFADFAQDPTAGSINVRWKNAGTGGSLFTIATPLSTSLGAAKVLFNFDLPFLSGLSNLNANYTLNVTVPSGNPAVNIGNSFDQPGLTGSFKFIYSGPAQTIGIYNLTPGENLLSATFFNDGDMTGKKKGTAGSIFDSTESGGVIIYTSDILSFATSQERDMSFSLNAVKPGFGFTAGKALNSFTAAETGEFGVAVPEPATWAMTILGFGFLGATLRRRRNATAAAAA